MTIVDFGFWILDREEEALRQFKNQQSRIINRQSSIMAGSGVRRTTFPETLKH
jgi:hypothetical protein